MENLLKKVREYIREKFKGVYEFGGGHGYRYFHALRVMRSVERYASSSKVDLTALRLACLLHDIGKLVKEDGELRYEEDEERHAKIGQRLLWRCLESSEQMKS